MATVEELQRSRAQKQQFAETTTTGTSTEARQASPEEKCVEMHVEEDALVRRNQNWDITNSSVMFPSCCGDFLQQ